jgi:invasion protein IalB
MMLRQRLFAAIALLALAHALSSSPASAKQERPKRLVQQSAASNQDNSKKQPPPTPYRTEILTFEHWTTTCRDFHEGPREHVCTAELKVAKSDSRQVLLDWVIGLDQNDKPIAVIETLPGVLIAPGVALRLGKTERKLPFTSCFPTHCAASMPVDGKFVKDIGAASEAEVVIQAPNGRAVKFKFPIQGFAKAYAALRH